MGELAKIKSYRREIALAETWDDIKIAETKGAALAEIAKRMNIAVEGQNQLGRTRIELEKKKGEKLDELFPHGGGRNFKLDIVELEKMPVSPDESSQARLIKNEDDLAEEVMNEIEAKGDIITPPKVASGIKKRKRKDKIDEIKEKIKTENISLKGLYDVIVIDPPWAYEEKGGFAIKDHDQDGNRGGVDYPTMTINEIGNIKLPLKTDAVVFLWTTHAFLRDAFNLLDIWKLQYKAIIVWDKEKMGMGRTIRLQCEFCLLAVKGKPLIEGNAERDIIRESRREHSRKPEAFYEMVERMTIGRRLDYFSREKRINWDGYGAETGKF